MELANCDWGLCPTVFQRGQFPPAFQNKLTLMHDGIDTDFFLTCPVPAWCCPAWICRVRRGRDLCDARDGTYRGFPQFMRAADILLKQRPDLHIVVGGDDSVSYSKLPPRGRTYKQMMLDELPDLANHPRLHFVGRWITRSTATCCARPTSMSI